MMAQYFTVLTAAQNIFNDRSLAKEERDVVMSVCDELKTAVSARDAGMGHAIEHPIPEVSLLLFSFTRDSTVELTQHSQQGYPMMEEGYPMMEQGYPMMEQGYPFPSTQQFGNPPTSDPDPPAAFNPNVQTTAGFHNNDLDDINLPIPLPTLTESQWALSPPLPYNPHWMSLHHIPDTYLQGWTSNIKIQDLIRQEGLLTGDFLKMTLHTNTNSPIDRYIRIQGLEWVPVPQTKKSRAEMLVSLLDETFFPVGGAPGRCMGVNGVVELMVTNTPGVAAPGRGTRKGSRELRVLRPDQQSSGGLVDLGPLGQFMARFSLWQVLCHERAVRLGNPTRGNKAGGYWAYIGVSRGLKEAREARRRQLVGAGDGDGDDVGAGDIGGGAGAGTGAGGATDAAVGAEEEA